MVMHTVHTAESLFLAFRVRDQSVRATPAAANMPWLNDSIEVYLDGDRVANDYTPVTRPIGGNREGFLVRADALGNQSAVGREVGGSRWKVGASRTEDGYVIPIRTELPCCARALVRRSVPHAVRPTVSGRLVLLVRSR